jgi:hypothetical protein
MYTANGESSYKCESCAKKLRAVRSENTPVRTLKSPSASKVDETSPSFACDLAPQFKGIESLSAQLEAVRLNGVCSNSLLENLIEMVQKLSDEVCQLRSDNQSLKAKTESIALPCASSFVLEPLTGREVKSPLPKDIAVKSYVCLTIKNCPSARCASAANVVCRDVDVFRNHNVSLEHILL